MESQQNFYPGENEDDDLQQTNYTEDVDATDDLEDDEDDLEDDDYEDDEDDTDSDDAAGSLDTRIGADSDVDDSDAESAI
jgi:hypothetical protein